MEYEKINNLLDSESENLSKFVTRNYVKVNNLSNTYNENKSITFKTHMLRSDLCDYADAYILVNGTITVAGNRPRNRPLILKNNAPLLEYSKNYRESIGSLYNYYRDELNDDANLNNFANNNVVSSNSFQYKNNIIGNTYNVDSTIVPAGGGARVASPNYDANDSGKNNVELAIPLKYLGNFWRALNIPLISCEVSLELKWNKTCVITSQQIGVNLDGGNTAAPTNATLAINDCKLYIPVVTLSKDDEITN